MRTIAIALSVFLIAAGSFAAEQTSAGATSKLAAMLAAKNEQGQPIITPEEHAYFDGLNDNLKELLNQAAQKEIITRPEHLADAAVACNCAHKRWSCFSKTIACSATAIQQINLPIRFSQSHRPRRRQFRT